MSLFARIKAIPTKIRAWSTKKKLIVGLSVFAVIAIGATTGLIIWQNSQNENIARYDPNKVVGKTHPDESSLLIKGLDEIYYTN